MVLKYRLRCNDCGEPLFADGYLHSAPDQMVVMNFKETAYSCDWCGFIGAPYVEEVRV